MTIENTEQTVTTATPGPVAPDGAPTTARATVHTSSTTATPSGSELGRRITILVFGLIQIVIGARIVLLLLDAREGNGLVSGILNLSQLFVGPFEGILKAGIDPLLRRPIRLSGQEFRDLVEFVQDALFDERVVRFCERLPAAVPSGLPLQRFEGCE